MKIIVNGETSEEFQEPNPDQSVEDYLDDLNDELSKVNQSAHCLQIDGRDYQASDASIQCSEINEISLRVADIDTVIADSITELGDYCKRYLNKIPEIIEDWEEYSDEQCMNYRDQVVHALEVSEGIMDSVRSITEEQAKELELDTIIQRAIDIRIQLEEASLDETKNVLNQDVNDFFADLLEKLQEIIDDLVEKDREYVQKYEQLIELVEKRIATIPDLIDQLQKGQQAQSYEDLEELAEDLQAINSILFELDEVGRLRGRLSENHQELVNESHQELSAGLDELSDAIKERDTILICDILEYEVLPYLQNLQKAFEPTKKT